MTNEDAHRLAREKGVSRAAYAVVRGVLEPFMRVYYRTRITGAEHIPDAGAAIIAPNHKSFWDSFFIALATRRPLRFMGKSELFAGRRGRMLIRLGAFPVRRGESDADALETARTVLRQGGLLALFPEGTRVRDLDALGEPRRGAARLALESGAPLIPAAIDGTSRLFVRGFPVPRRVQVSFAAPIAVSEEAAASPEAAAALMGEAWPEVEREFKTLRARPGVIAAGVAAVGLGAFLAARRRRRD